MCRGDGLHALQLLPKWQVRTRPWFLWLEQLNSTVRAMVVGCLVGQLVFFGHESLGI